MTAVNHPSESGLTCRIPDNVQPYSLVNATTIQSFVSESESQPYLRGKFPIVMEGSWSWVIRYGLWTIWTYLWFFDKWISTISWSRCATSIKQHWIVPVMHAGQCLNRGLWEPPSLISGDILLLDEGKLMLIS